MVADHDAPSRPGPAPAALAGREATDALLQQLAGWLPRQRWFPGRGELSDLAVISDVALTTSYPALRHLIIEAVLPGGPARFQVLVGYRPDRPWPAGLSFSPDSALIGHYEGVTCYDALHDPEAAGVLLRGIGEQRLAGHIRFVREPGSPSLTGTVPGGRLLGAEQSNTSLVFGDQVILKVLRRLFPGANPDLEIADALARLGSKQVAAPYGWIETELDGEAMLLGVLSQFLAGASDGWALALASVRRLLSGEQGEQGEQGGQASFEDEAGLLGQATARLHADLARAFGSRDMTADELAELAAGMHRKLAEAVAVVGELRRYEPQIRAAYDAVGQLSTPVPVQRIHGDYHLGQVLRAQHGWVALDFEGEPAVPLALRRAAAPALRDVAGMLRSLDYAARHQLVGGPVTASEAGAASAWAAQCQDAFCAGYAAAGGYDPRSHATLLRALMLEKAVYEVVYEYRHRPSWLPIPLDFVAAA